MFLPISFGDVKVSHLKHGDVTTEGPRAEVCVGMWSAVWAAGLISNLKVSHSVGLKQVTYSLSHFFFTKK